MQIKIIHHGSSHSVVEKWQTFLNEDKDHDSYGRTLTVDGDYGHSTKDATANFQKKKGLTQDGIAGHYTLQAAEASGFKIPSVNNHKPGLPVICDLSVYQSSVNFSTIKGDGITAVIHRATHFPYNKNTKSYYIATDKMYASRKKAALSEKLLWGAYHFGTNVLSGKAQATYFLDHIHQDNDTIMVLDLEISGTDGHTTMTIEQAQEFVNEIYEQTGKYPGLYINPTHFNSMMARHGSSDPGILSNCWLWIAHWASQSKLPDRGWNKYTLWQYRGGDNYHKNRGNYYSKSHINGVSGGCDVDTFNGKDQSELDAFWNTNKEWTRT